ncbi:MAG: serine/threonine protein kinase [Proteobacteria bacterium]|nr:serine/threonine protein kinase [Pseudomonadota bacterium]
MHTFSSSTTVCDDAQMTVNDESEASRLSDSGNPNPFKFDQKVTVSYQPRELAEQVTKCLNEKFVPLKKIAEGGMGQIFVAQERMSGRIVALKVMTPKAMGKPEFVQQFVREAVITARLQHSNIIPIYDIGFVTNNLLYYTMRYVAGEPLSKCLPRLAPKNRLRVLRHAASAVHLAHCQGLWHRDIKPANILVAKDGGVYVIDWGTVTVQRGANYRLHLPTIVVQESNPLRDPLPDLLLEATSNALSTMDALLVGTPAYMAPEQLSANDRIMGPASDVWAFGLMLYECLSGSHPYQDFAGEHPKRIWQYLLEHGVPCPTSLFPYAPRRLTDLCREMLQLDASRRLASLQIVVDMLDEILGDSALFCPPGQSSHTAAGLTLLAPAEAGASSSAQTLVRTLPLHAMTIPMADASGQAIQSMKLRLLLELAQVSWWQVSRRRQLKRQLIALGGN